MQPSESPESFPNRADKPNPPGWFEKPENIQKIVRTLFVVCGLLLLADLFIDVHGYLAVESWFLFAGVYGFLAYSFIVISARGLRRFLMREEDYYDG